MGCRFDGAALKPSQFRPESVTRLEGLLEDSVSPCLPTPQGPVSSLPRVVFSRNQGQGTQFTLFLFSSIEVVQACLEVLMLRTTCPSTSGFLKFWMSQFKPLAMVHQWKTSVRL